MALAVKFQNGNRKNPNVQVFEKKDAGFVIGKCNDRTLNPNDVENPLWQIADTLCKFNCPVYFMQGWARDSYVRFRDTYFARDISYLKGNPISVCEGGFCIDNGKVALVLVPEMNLLFSKVKEDLAMLKTRFLDGMEFVLLPYQALRGKHIDLYASLFGSTLLVDNYYLHLTPQILSDLARHGINVRLFWSVSFEFNIPIFEIDGRKIALIHERTTDNTRNSLKLEGICPYEVDFGLVPRSLRLENLGGGIRCATNWIDNPDILDFFGITYERIF